MKITTTTKTQHGFFIIAALNEVEPVCKMVAVIRNDHFPVGRTALDWMVA